ncbi:Na+/H+ antiporter [Salmonella enterica subsp. indica]|uniref:Na+/H+ antiporter n=1 Tax=Salmonella enterica subsp. indica TaxID=59207 RepID=A0A379YHK4_SALER|nr:Na+/H+ antiporter [Salmonella enterica subsp. indica]
MLPLLLQHLEVADHAQQLKEERIARAATAEVAIVAIQKMEERLAADTEENIDNQLLTEVSSRVIGNLRRRADGRNDVESSIQEENLERRFRLAALRSERAELYHLRATREISNETLQKLLHDPGFDGSASDRKSVVLVPGGAMLIGPHDSDFNQNPSQQVNHALALCDRYTPSRHIMPNCQRRSLSSGSQRSVALSRR